MSQPAGALSVVRRHEIRLLVAFVYCALVLTLLEYWFLSFRVRASGWVDHLPANDRELWSALIWVAVTSFFFLVVPALIVRLWHREPLASVGFGFTGVLRHLPVYLLLFAAMVPVLMLVSKRPEFLQTYPFVKAPTLGVLLSWECAYVFQFFALESFFRGYLLFTAEKVAPRAAIAIVAVPYTMIHFHKPFLECLGALGAGLLLGFLALRYRSFWGGVLLHSMVAVSMDLLAIRVLWKL